jgi:hypothetical protein
VLGGLAQMLLKFCRAIRHWPDWPSGEPFCALRGRANHKTVANTIVCNTQFCRANHVIHKLSSAFLSLRIGLEIWLRQALHLKFTRRTHSFTNYGGNYARNPIKGF